MNYESVFCHFCQVEVTNYLCSDKASIYDCPNCTAKHGLNRAVMVTDDNGRYIYAHMYIDFGDGTRNYHIRLHLLENFTHVGWYRTLEGYTGTSTLILPGFPLKPSNVKDKLKLYMLFS